MNLSATLSLTGGVTISAAWIDEISDAASAPTCEDAVKGFTQDNLRYAVPRTPLTTTFSGHTVRIYTIIGGYHGPGRYEGGVIAGDDGTGVMVSVDSNKYGIVPGTMLSAVVMPDNSGTVTYTNLGIVGVAGPGTVSGTLSWSCSTLRPPSPTPVGTPPPATLPVLTTPTPTTATQSPAPAGSPTPSGTKPKPTPTPTPLPH